MSVVLLANTIQADAAQILVTDTSNVATTDGTAVENVTGGPRSLAWSSGSSDARRVVYLNRNAGLGCTHVVLARADQFDGKGVSLISWSSYSAASNTEYLATVFNETLIGPRQQDWVYPLELSGKHAIGLSMNSVDHVKNVYKFFVSSGFELTHALPPSYRRLPFPSRHPYRREQYLVDAEWTFTVDKLSRDEVDEFEAIPNLLSEPVFLYDSDGYHIDHKLIHGVVSDVQVSVPFDDFYQMSFRIQELRSWQ